jgi:hypothetical protein
MALTPASPEWTMSALDARRSTSVFGMLSMEFAFSEPALCRVADEPDSNLTTATKDAVEEARPNSGRKRPLSCVVSAQGFTPANRAVVFLR